MTVTVGSSVVENTKKGFHDDGAEVNQVLRTLPLKVRLFFLFGIFQKTTRSDLILDKDTFDQRY